MEGEEETRPFRSIQRGTRRGGPSFGTIAAVAVAMFFAGAASSYLALRPSGAGPDLVRIDGSSTVFPITAAWAAEFNDEGRQVTVAFSGTGGGFKKFCRGESDLSDASREVKPSEIEACEANGITGLTEFLVAFDGLSVVVPAGNQWVDHLTVRQLCRIWTADATSPNACGNAGPQVNQWNELNASWPDRKIELFGPGTDSGTFDYFTEVILDEFNQSIRADFFASEDDNVLVQGIANEAHSTGYFGYAYVSENLDKVRPVPIDDEDPSNGAGPIAPSETTIKDGSYSPLSRPLFVYASSRSLSRDVIRDFLTFGYSPEGQRLLSDIGYVGLTPTEIQTQLGKIPG